MERSRKFYLIPLGLTLAWLIYFFFGNPLSQKMAARIGDLVLKVTKGNVSDAAAFIQDRLFETLFLITLVVASAWLHLKFTKLFLRSSASATKQWITHASSAFILFNVCLGFALQTTVFWCIMWQGSETQNLTRFHLKRLLFMENRSSIKAVILGNSQSRAQLDEELLNSLSESRMHTAELHFPGSNAYDIWLEHRKIRKARPNLVIVYLSEATFYNGTHHDAAANFFEFSDLKDLASDDVRSFVPSQGFQYGLLGAALPIFRIRDVLSQRILGTSLVQLKQFQHNQRRADNLEMTAEKIAAGYQIDETSAFEMRAFKEFVSDCKIEKENVLVLVGQLNPILSQHFDPKIREHMISFLRQLRDLHPNMILVENLPVQSPSDYEDLSHVKKEAQIQFTEQIAEFLRDNLAKLQSPP